MKSKEKIIYVKVVSTKPRKNRLLKCLGWSNFTVLFNWNKHQSPSSFPPPSPCSTSPPQTGHSHSLPVLLVSKACWGTGELDKREVEILMFLSAIVMMKNRRSSKCGFPRFRRTTSGVFPSCYERGITWWTCPSFSAKAEFDLRLLSSPPSPVSKYSEERDK